MGAEEGLVSSTCREVREFDEVTGVAHRLGTSSESEEISTTSALATFICFRTPAAGPDFGGLGKAGKLSDGIPGKHFQQTHAKSSSSLSGMYSDS